MEWGDRHQASPNNVGGSSPPSRQLYWRQLSGDWFPARAYVVKFYRNLRHQASTVVGRHLEIRPSWREARSDSLWLTSSKSSSRRNLPLRTSNEQPGNTIFSRHKFGNGRKPWLPFQRPVSISMLCREAKRYELLFDVGSHIIILFRFSSEFAAVNDSAARQRIYRFVAQENIVQRRRTHVAQNTRHCSLIMTDFLQCLDEHIKTMKVTMAPYILTCFDIVIVQGPC